MKSLLKTSMLLAAVAALALSTSQAQAGGFKISVGHGGHGPKIYGGGGGCYTKKYVNHGHVYTKKYCPTPVVRHVVAPVRPITKVPAGSLITIPCHRLGALPGKVFLHVGSVKLPVAIAKWTPTAVTLQLPPMAIEHPTRAHLDIFLPCGRLARKADMLLVMPAPAGIVVH